MGEIKVFNADVFPDHWKISPITVGKWIPCPLEVSAINSNKQPKCSPMIPNRPLIYIL